MLDEIRGYVTRCDVCEKAGPTVKWRIGMTDSITDLARRAAKKQGWKRAEGHDYCAACAKRLGVK